MDRKRFRALATLSAWLMPMAAIPSPVAAQPHPRADIVIYGCTSGGVVAAIEARRLGRSVLLVCREDYLGGMSANGLGWSDTGNHRAIGGLSLEFYRKVKRYYDDPSVWVHAPRPAQAENFVDGDAMWQFEPKVAERIFEDWAKQAGVTIVRNQPLDRSKRGVEMDGNRITAFRSKTGQRFEGKIFIDATYEGDLMAGAGISFTVGREGNATYGETLNGVQLANTTNHQFTLDIDPYRVPGDPSSGLVPRISAERPARDGTADRKIQAYTYRMCLTDVPANRVPFPKPAGYDASQYMLLKRYMDAGYRDYFRKFDRIPNGKTDTNNFGAFSFDNIGMNYGYPEGTDADRAAIAREHTTYQQGLLWFMANDPGVPAETRAEMSKWGLCKDEFTGTGHWPREMYVREARRMVSDFVMAEPHLRGTKPTPRPVGMGSYNMDSHNVQRIVDARGFARNEGNIEISPGRAYPISYDAIVPKKREAANLLVPVALSASHIAYGSIRMEPVFMILGQSAAAASSIAIDDQIAVQDVDYDKLRARLTSEGQILELAH
ncbi:xanthan lyase [Sphingopyxis sp. Root214]|uniref:FAD-dependent oxidoreductase n=1 Tax=unclassified Sphingopyxis TaxID=2614943 RepID=UPI0006F91B62|nr:MULTISPECIES: FAD-dependent oxidoreductase [unclassified Sphingopyxis]KQZ76776.1 xanthan lyase [Sphingopyxis sp. Root154]KRC09337.1 xanthan lyase [Sphingopyxis sp. Root214]